MQLVLWMRVLSDMCSDVTRSWKTVENGDDGDAGLMVEVVVVDVGGGPCQTAMGMTLVVPPWFLLMFRDALSTAGNSMTSSERPSGSTSEEGGVPSRTEGETILEMPWKLQRP